MRTVVIDFETHAIANRPTYPPEPVGVAILDPSIDKCVYMAWGHPNGNNCQISDAVELLRLYWADPSCELVFHNAKFDLAVAHEKLGLPELPWWRVHDTMFLLFLADPHAKSLGLKEAAEEYLGWAPEERDTVADWVWLHRQELESAYGGKVTKSKAGAWIAYAPGRLVSDYAEGDVKRTLALFEHLYPLVEREGMRSAYDRERQLLPILMENERIGLRIDVAALSNALESYRVSFAKAENWIRGVLGDINLDADRKMAAALVDRELVDVSRLSRTKTGRLSVAKDSLTPDMFSDPRLAAALGYRNRLKTCMTMFMEPWYAQATAGNGRIYPNWNQVRGGSGGTRTGRPSTYSPNLLNISKSFDGRGDGYEHPAFLGVARLPLVRKFILPDEGDTFIDIDFSGQELRVFAHFEQGALFNAYLADPDLDPHGWVKDKLEELTGMSFTRLRTKVLNFQAIYGGGAPAAAKQLNCSLAQAREYKAFHDRALPGRKTLYEEILRLVRRGDPVATWGGRKYFPEKPTFLDGRRQTWEYKLINYVIQGSAADLTKQAIIDWYGHPMRNARFLVQVYDEIAISAPESDKTRQLGVLRDAMQAQRLSVPMRTDAAWGRSWGEVEGVR